MRLKYTIWFGHKLEWIGCTDVIEDVKATNGHDSTAGKVRSHMFTKRYIPGLHLLLGRTRMRGIEQWRFVSLISLPLSPNTCI